MEGRGKEIAVADMAAYVVPPAITNMVDTMLIIQQNLKLSAAEKLLQSREQYWSAQLEQQLTRKVELTSEISSIIGFFSVFQGVMIAAVSQLKSDTYSTCKLILWPILLTCLVALVGIVAFCVKWSYRHDVEKMICSSNKDLKAARELLNEFQKLESDYRNADHYSERVLGRFSSIKRILAVLAMLLFSGVFIMAYFAILCDCLVIRKWEGGL